MSRVALLGYSGETGKMLVKNLMGKQSRFTNIQLIGRKELLPQIQAQYDTSKKSMSEKIIDFEKMMSGENPFDELDQCFVALGSSIEACNNDKSLFKRYSKDYITQLAKHAHEKGCRHFHVITGAGSTKKHFHLYPITKAELEEDLIALKLNKLSIYRPGILLCDRVEHRGYEIPIRKIAGIISCFNNDAACSTDNLAKAMIYNGIKSESTGHEWVSNRKCISLAKKFDAEI